jgi:serine/threonine-protein kinase
MAEYMINNTRYRLKEPHDLSFLSRYGTVFCVFDENDSGNISFGVDNGSKKYFIKIAGLHTMSSCISTDAAIDNLQKAMTVYEEIQHSHLIELYEHFGIDDLYVAVFKWVDGECLFDHWNFEKYANDPSILPPCDRFRQLPIQKRLKAFDTVLSFVRIVAQCGYFAMDFYDGSLMYDFKKDTLTVCDIDFFAKMPLINHMGKMWGSSRFMSPEEYQFGAVIDEITNVFTVGAISFMFFGDDRDRSAEKWNAGQAMYEVAKCATNTKRNKRYQSIDEFINVWNIAIL